jgi:hypothetical protein
MILLRKAETYATEWGSSNLYQLPATQIDHIKKTFCRVAAEREMMSKLIVMYFVTHQIEHFLVLTECAIEFKLHGMSNMEKCLK